MDGSYFDQLTRRLGQHTERRRVISGITTGILAAAGLSRAPILAHAKGEKIWICHATGRSNTPYRLIEVAASAVPAHQSHGDYPAYLCEDGPSCSPCAGIQCYTSTVGLIPRGEEFGPNDPWVVCRADEQSAWLSSAAWGQYDPLAACQSLGYSGVGGAGGTCEHVCGYCGDGETSCDNPGTERYDYDGGWDPDVVWCGAPENTDNPIPGTICNTVVWECLA